MADDMLSFMREENKKLIPKVASLCSLNISERKALYSHAFAILEQRCNWEINPKTKSQSCMDDERFAILSPVLSPAPFEYDEIMKLLDGLCTDREEQRVLEYFHDGYSCWGKYVFDPFPDWVIKLVTFFSVACGTIAWFATSFGTLLDLVVTIIVVAAAFVIGVFVQHKLLGEWFLSNYKKRCWDKFKQDEIRRSTRIHDWLRTP